MEQITIPVQNVALLAVQAFDGGDDYFSHDLMYQILRARFTWDTTGIDSFCTTFMEEAGFLQVTPTAEGTGRLTVAIEYYLISNPTPQHATVEMEIIAVPE